MPDDDPIKIEDHAGVSRRDFLKISTITATVPLVAGPQTVLAAGEQVPVYGPGKVPVVLTVNGKKYNLQLEPRVTLLDALRDDLDITGAKRVCDKAECGACTVLMENKPVYACSVLAIEAQGKRIETVEALMQNGKLHPIQQAFVDHDASQCGFCTPGFVVACKSFLDRHPNPTPEDIRKGLSGNLCRCGTYAGIREAIARSARKGA
ncbi:MAG TPA: (2Fe-2S)-binding protein [Terriglobales bacterium]|nr:(2Fe-2S)-binding protein [Terriglobales bacterium]